MITFERKKSSEEDCLKEILDALNVKQLGHIDNKKKLEFAQHILNRLPGKQRVADDESGARAYEESLLKKASSAATALCDYHNHRYLPATTHNIAIRQGLMVSTDINENTLKELIGKFEIISTSSDKEKKTSIKKIKVTFTAEKVARSYLEMFGKKPTHNCHFSTSNYNTGNWDKKEHGNPLPFDMICYAIYRHTGISFSEAVLREVAKGVKR